VRTRFEEAGEKYKGVGGQDVKRLQTRCEKAEDKM
jgi:hypothetical protein